MAGWNSEEATSDRVDLFVQPDSDDSEGEVLPLDNGAPLALPGRSDVVRTSAHSTRRSQETGFIQKLKKMSAAEAAKAKQQEFAKRGQGMQNAAVIRRHRERQKEEEESLKRRRIEKAINAAKRAAKELKLPPKGGAAASSSMAALPAPPIVTPMRNSGRNKNKSPILSPIIEEFGVLPPINEGAEFFGGDEWPGGILRSVGIVATD